MKLSMVRSILQSVVEGAIKRFTGSGGPDETFTNREHFQHYGFTSIPQNGAEGIVLREGNYIILIGEDDRRYRLAINTGEVALYTDEGDAVYLKRGNTIELRTQHLQVGDSSASHPVPLGDTLESWLNTHTHMTPTGPSGVPLSLLTGSELSTLAKVKN